MFDTPNLTNTFGCNINDFKLYILIINMKFAHFADCHLGSWRQPELRQLNLESFKRAIDICIKEKVEFIVVAGDLFDSAYPPIEILEETFSELRRVHNAGISCYIIAGSHDFSASGKTFLSVLERAEFCKSIYLPEEREGFVYLSPVLHKNVALYGYPGKKAGLEVRELKNVRLHDSPFFRIFALHTSIADAVKGVPMECVNEWELPDADYYALGHLHVNYRKNRYVYAGPIFPNNFQELEELRGGSFYIVNTEPFEARKIELRLKEIESVELEVINSLTATEGILADMKKRNIKDKIVLLKVWGKLKTGKISDIKFDEIEKLVKEMGGHILLKNTSKLLAEEPEVNLQVENMDQMEEEMIKEYSKNNPSKFDYLIPQIVNVLAIDKEDGETNETFETRLLDELNKLINFRGEYDN